MLYRRQIRELEKFQQRYLRKISNIKWTDLISNKEVLHTAKTPATEMFITKNHLWWLGHVHRVNNWHPKMVQYGEMANRKRKEEFQGQAPHPIEQSRNHRKLGRAGTR